MKTDRIDFISAYCDRWCDRCAFTSRCSAFAVDIAAAMCGDFEAGLELAVGTPHPVGASRHGGQPAHPWLEFENVEMSTEKQGQYDRRAKARKVRIDNTPIMKSAWAITMVAHRWCVARAEVLSASADDVLREALEIARRDATFVITKISRALHGRDEHEQGDDMDDDPVQNDWNGSAKVALISLERSEAAWHVIAQSTGDSVPAALAGQVADLRRAVDQAFPRARSFIRPGFDEPDR
jgi:hypothetical protein